MKDFLSNATEMLSKHSEAVISDEELAKSKIRRNKEILSLREAEAKKNKGKFSTKTPIE